MKRTKGEKDDYDHNDPKIRKEIADENWERSRRNYAIKQIFGEEARIMNVLLATPEQDYLQPPQNSLFIYGVINSGKTIDACRRTLPAIKQWHYDSSNIEKKAPIPMPVIVFYDVQNLLYKIRCTYNKESKIKEQDIVDKCINCDILILDDLSSERDTADGDSKISFIIHQRHSKMKTTIITSNKMLTNQSGYDMRIVRRISDSYEFIHYTKTWKEKSK